MKLAFSVKGLAGLPTPAAGREYHYDLRQPGLALCITDNGVRTFYVIKKVHGRPQRNRLGRLGEITIEQARDRAAKIIADIAAGLDPMDMRRSARSQPTLANLTEHWIEKHAKPHKKTWKEDERLVKKHLTALKPRRLSTITRADVSALHQGVGEHHGHYAANRLLALLRSMFGKAVDLGYEGPNPCIGVKKYKEESRDRYLLPNELPAFFKALKAYPDETLRDFFLIALLTGARRGNVQSMCWADVDLDAGRWRIPDTKGGQPVVLPLSEAALTVLITRRKNANGSPWVFPGHRHGTYLKEPKTAWKAILDSAGIGDLRIHDLRRTLGSWQAILGTSLPIIGKSLGHRSTASTSIYARLGVEPVETSVNRATAAILAAAEPEEVKKNAKLKAAGKPRRTSKAKGAHDGQR